MIPVLDLIEIGSGGGSVAWVDNLGLLKVGPHSAGASPGPACYGLGGTEIAPIINEYERTSTTVSDGYVKPAVSRYLHHIERDLAAAGYTGQLFVICQVVRCSGAHCAEAQADRDFLKRATRRQS